MAVARRRTRRSPRPPQRRFFRGRRFRMLRVSYACRLRFGAFDAGPDHLTAMAVIIVEREVLGAAIVPDGKRSLRPSEPPGEILVHRMAVDMRQERVGLRLYTSGH